MEYLGAVVALAFTVGVFFLLVPGMRPPDRRFARGRRPMGALDLRRAGSVDDAGAWAAPLVGLLALSTLVGPQDGGGAGSAAGVGVVGGLMSISRGLTRLRNLGLSVMGVVAAAIGVSQLLSGGLGCAPAAQRGLVLAVTLVTFAIGLGISLVRFSIHATVGLEAFVVVEIATFLAAPLGVDLVGGSRVVALAVAAALGLLVGIAPRAVFGLVGVAVGTATLFGSTVSSGCGLGGGTGQLTAFASGLVVFGIVFTLVGRWRA